MTRPLAILALFICQQSLLADSSIKIHWEQLCSASAGHKLAISTADGKTLQGKCESTDATTLRLNQGSGKVVTLERAAIKQITARDSHHVLGNVWGFFLGAILVTHYIAWPLNVIVAPVAIGLGVAASPFALGYDLFDSDSGENIEIVGL